MSRAIPRCPFKCVYNKDGLCTNQIVTFAYGLTEKERTTIDEQSTFTKCPNRKLDAICQENESSEDKQKRLHCYDGWRVSGWNCYKDCAFWDGKKCTNFET